MQIQRDAQIQQQKLNEKVQAEQYGNMGRQNRMTEAEISAIQSFNKNQPMLNYLQRKQAESTPFLPPLKLVKFKELPPLRFTLLSGGGRFYFYNLVRGVCSINFSTMNAAAIPEVNAVTAFVAI